MTEELIDDSEMPVAPAPGDAAVVAPVDGAFDGDILDGIPAMGEAIPIGTYHFRLDSYTEGWNEPAVDPKTGLAKDPDMAAFGRQPYFMLNWSCQQEPHTGRGVTEFAGWCTPQVFEAAKAGDRTAKKLVASKLFVIKDILAAAGLKAMGNMNIKDFLGGNPELKIQLKLQQGKSKNAAGVYVVDGTMRNGVVKHVSLTRPA